jgi:urea transport system permease protein
MVEVWQYIIGAVFCVTILFFKGGIVGIVTDQLPTLVRKIKGKNASSVVASKSAKGVAKYE